MFRPLDALAQAAGDGRRSEPPESDEIGQLSMREMEVTRRAIAGLSLKAIAAELAISPHTAATYLSRARRKLRQKSRWKLAVRLMGLRPQFSELAPASLSVTLEPAERVLGEMVLAGLSNAEIAQGMGTNSKVAGRQVATLLRRIGVKTRLELFSRAFRGGR